MNKRRLWYGALLVLLARGAGATPREELLHALTTMQAPAEYMKLHVLEKRASGTERQHFSYWSSHKEGLDTSLICFRTPAMRRGRAVLTMITPERVLQYYKASAISPRVLRIVPGRAGDTVPGTLFTYEVLRSSSPAYYEGVGMTFRYEEANASDVVSATFPSGRTHTMELSPDGAIREVRFYDEAGVLARTLVYTAIQHAGARWYADRFTVRDQEGNTAQTVVQNRQTLEELDLTRWSLPKLCR